MSNDFSAMNELEREKERQRWNGGREKNNKQKHGTIKKVNNLEHWLKIRLFWKKILNYW